jgi:hypothetical protein
MLRKTLLSRIKANQTWGCINPLNPNGINCCINMCQSWLFIDLNFFSTICLPIEPQYYDGTFKLFSLDRNVFNSSGNRTYEAMGLKIFPGLRGSHFSHKCFRILQSSMLRRTLMVSFAPIMNLIKLSQMFFSMCITSSVCRIINCCKWDTSMVRWRKHGLVARHT